MAPPIDFRSLTEVALVPGFRKPYLLVFTARLPAPDLRRCFCKLFFITVNKKDKVTRQYNRELANYLDYIPDLRKCTPHVPLLLAWEPQGSADFDGAAFLDAFLGAHGDDMDANHREQLLAAAADGAPARLLVSEAIEHGLTLETLLSGKRLPDGSLPDVSHADVQALAVQLAYTLRALERRGLAHNDAYCETNLMASRCEPPLRLAYTADAGAGGQCRELTVRWFLHLIDFDLMTLLEDGPQQEGSDMGVALESLLKYCNVHTDALDAARELYDEHGLDVPAKDALRDFMAPLPPLDGEYALG